MLFTADRRVFFGHDDNTIRVADEWERDEVLLQMLVWRDRFPVDSNRAKNAKNESQTRDKAPTQAEARLAAVRFSRDQPLLETGSASRG